MTSALNFCSSICFRTMPVSWRGDSSLSTRQDQGQSHCELHELLSSIRLTINQELMPCLRPLQNLRTLTIDTEPWVNTAPFSRIWSPGDRMADAIGDAQAVSQFNQKPTTVARSMFSIFPSLTTAWVIASYNEASQYGVERNADQSVNRLVSEQLRESGSEFSFEFSPLSTLFPKRDSVWSLW